MRNLLLLFIGAMLLTSCGTSISTTGTWIDNDKIRPDDYDNVFIMALTPKLNVKQTVENDLGAEFEKRGLLVYKSHETFPPGFDKSAPAAREEMANIIAAKGCDAIFTVALIDQSSDTRYVPGSTVYTPAYSYGYWGYYSAYYPTFYDPGYYTTDKTYFIESNIYDAKTGDIVYSIQTETYNPNNLSSWSRDYTILMIKELKKAGIIQEQ